LIEPTWPALLTLLVLGMCKKDIPLTMRAKTSYQKNIEAREISSQKFLPLREHFHRRLHFHDRFI
jgi:hypothetical protein